MRYIYNNILAFEFHRLEVEQQTFYNSVPEKKMKQDISNVEGTSNNNITKNAPESKNDTGVWKTIANYLSLG